MSEYLWALQSYNVEHSDNKIILTTMRDPKDLTILPFESGGEIAWSRAGTKPMHSKGDGSDHQIIELQNKEWDVFRRQERWRRWRVPQPWDTEGCDASAWEIREVAKELASDTNDCDPSRNKRQSGLTLLAEMKPILHLR